MSIQGSQFGFARSPATRTVRTWSFLALIFLGFQFSTRQALAEPSKEYQIKAVCLWRLAQFVEWPAKSFENPDNPIVIGVLGENPFGDALDVAVRGETAHGRSLIVQHYKRVEDARSSHILFISKSETGRINQVLGALAGRSILTVSDIEEFAHDNNNGMIRLFTEQNKIKMRISLKAANSAGLVLDARLLRMVEVVKSK